LNRPDGQAVAFAYDALGRRTAKSFTGTVTRWVWDGDVPLHEWSLPAAAGPPVPDDAPGAPAKGPAEPVATARMVTWVFDEGTFTPAAKIVGGRPLSIVADPLGTPVQMYDGHGGFVWDAAHDIHGNVRRLAFGGLHDCPFRFPGQYADEETGLHYTRFRYYDPGTGGYLSQDPIRLEGGDLNFYAYVRDSNSWTDVFGLMELFRSMTRTEYYDIIRNGWLSREHMMAKWFADSYEAAVKFGHALGHDAGSDTKFYVVGFEIDDAVATAEDVLISPDQDRIGDARAIPVESRRSMETPVISIHSHRIKCK
jgi:RHS repeat-associated protein